MSAAAPRARVEVRAQPLWRLRLGLGITRYALWLVAAVGIVATVRFTLAPPHPRAAPPVNVDATDLAGESFATVFARAYLSWNAANPTPRQRALAPFIDAGVDPDAGFSPPSSGEQTVQWAEVVQGRGAGPAERVYTVAAQTDRAGLLYITVDVERDAAGRLELVRYPAFVGAPAQAASGLNADEHDADVADAQLRAIVHRALDNYLRGDLSDLQADLAAGARVALPGLQLQLQSVEQLKWAGRGTLVAVISAAGSDGAVYTLSYELDVVRAAGRWELAAVQMDPTR